MSQPYREPTFGSTELDKPNLFKQYWLSFNYRYLKMFSLFIRKLFGGKYMSYDTRVFCWIMVCYVGLAMAGNYTFNFNKIVAVWSVALFVIFIGAFKASNIKP